MQCSYFVYLFLGSSAFIWHQHWLPFDLDLNIRWPPCGALYFTSIYVNIFFVLWPLPHPSSPTLTVQSFTYKHKIPLVVDSCRNASHCQMFLDHYWHQCAYLYLKLFGHKNVSVLDGGLRKWLEDGFDVTTDEPEVEVNYLLVI